MRLPDASFFRVNAIVVSLRALFSSINLSSVSKASFNEISRRSAGESHFPPGTGENFPATHAAFTISGILPFIPSTCAIRDCICSKISLIRSLMT